MVSKTTKESIAPLQQPKESVTKQVSNEEPLPPIIPPMELVTLEQYPRISLNLYDNTQQLL